MRQFDEKNTESEKSSRSHNWQKALVFVLAAILLVLILTNLSALLSPFQRLNSILAPIIIGLVIAYICNPIMKFFEMRVFKKVKRHTVNRGLSMLCAYLLLLLFIAGVVLLIVPNMIESVNDLRNNGMSYVNRLIASINRMAAMLPFSLTNDENLLTLEKLLTVVIGWISDYGTNIAGGVTGFASGAITVLKNILVGIFVSIYVLLSKDRLYAGAKRAIRALFHKKQEDIILRYLSTANSKLGGFILGKSLDSLTVGFICAILFLIFRIPYPILIAVIVGVTDFIPFFGPFIGAIPSAMIIFIASPSKALLFLILIFAVQQLDGNLLAPYILGDHTGLTSLGVLVAITLMSGLLGFAGMVLGVPLFALIMIILDDLVKAKLEKKGCPTDLYSYYSADAFISPADEADQTLTATKKFAHWVAAVEEEEEDPMHPRRFNRTLRRALLVIGRFLHRVFACKPSEKDGEDIFFKDIYTHGIRENRGFFRTLFFTVFSLFIYPVYLIEMMAECTNIACKEDGKRTWGAIPFLLFSVLTCGVFAVVWNCLLLHRLRDYALSHGEVCRFNQKKYLLWTLVGLPTVVGPCIGIAGMLAAFNQMAHIYNTTYGYNKAKVEIKE